MKINDKNLYKLSKDYKRLKELVDDGYIVVCFVDYSYTIDDMKRTRRDICALHHMCYDNYPKGEEYSFGGRGYCYGNLYPNDSVWKESFEEFCQGLNVEFIDIEKTNE